LCDWEVMFKSHEPVRRTRRTLPDVRRLGARRKLHEACVEHPDICAREIGKFIASQGD